MRERSSRRSLLLYLPALCLAGWLAWRNRSLLSTFTEVEWLPLSLAAAFGIACGMHVALRSRRALPGLVAGAGVILLMTMAVVAMGQALSVDGCIGIERQEQQQAAQDKRPTAKKPLNAGSGPADLEKADGKEVGSQTEEKQKVYPVDCAELSANPDRRIALVTMRLTLFAAIGTFLFGLVAVFALLGQVRPDDRD